MSHYTNNKDTINFDHYKRLVRHICMGILSIPIVIIVIPIGLVSAFLDEVVLKGEKQKKFHIFQENFLVSPMSKLGKHFGIGLLAWGIIFIIFMVVDLILNYGFLIFIGITLATLFLPLIILTIILPTYAAVYEIKNTVLRNILFVLITLVILFSPFLIRIF